MNGTNSTPTPNATALRRRVKKSAKALALSDRCQLAFVECFIALVLTVSICDIIIYCLLAFIDSGGLYAENPRIYEYVDSFLYYLAPVLMFLFAAPVIWGYTDTGFKAYYGMEISGADIFAGFGKKTAGILAVAAVIMLPFALIFTASEVFGYFTELWSESGVITHSLAGTFDGLNTAGSIALYIIAFFFSGRYYTAFALLSSDRKAKTGEILKRARSCSKGRLFEIFVFQLSFTGWLALSLLTIGILAVVFTAPYAVTSYTCFSQELIKSNKQRITKDNEQPQI